MVMTEGEAARHQVEQIIGDRLAGNVMVDTDIAQIVVGQGQGFRQARAATAPDGGKGRADHLGSGVND